MKILLALVLFMSLALAEETSAPVEETPAVITTPSVWIVTEINLRDFKWADLGLEQERSFSDPLVQSWLKFMGENKAGQKEAKACDPACTTTHTVWQDQEAPLMSGTSSPLPGGHWLKLSFDISREKFGGKFKWQGRVVLLDVNSKVVLTSSELQPEEKIWSGLGQKEVNSALATRLYRSALPALKEIAAKLGEDLTYTQVARLVIRGAKSVTDVNSFLEVLKARGSQLGLQIKWETMGTGEARFHCFFRGGEKLFSDLLSDVKELKSSQSFEFTHEVSGQDHVINVVTR